jgi:kinetochore protein Spc7/SPC105
MANTEGKENIADGLIANASFKAPSALSPKKSSRKTRSKSIGPGGLGELDASALKESNGNRRKVCAPPIESQIIHR